MESENENRLKAKKEITEESYEKVNELTVRGVVEGVSIYGMNQEIQIGVMEHEREAHIQFALDRNFRGITKFELKDRVLIHGYFNGFNAGPDASRYIMLPTIVSMEHEKHELESRFDVLNLGHFYPEGFSLGFISGKIVSLSKPNHNWAVMTVETINGGSNPNASLLRLSYYTGSRFLPDYTLFQVGDIVAARVYIYTQDKRSKATNVLRHWQSLTIDDIDYLVLPKHPKRRTPASGGRRVVVPPETGEELLSDSGTVAKIARETSFVDRKSEELKGQVEKAGDDLSSPDVLDKLFGVAEPQNASAPKQFTEEEKKSMVSDSFSTTGIDDDDDDDDEA